MFPGSHLEQHGDKLAIVMAGSGFTQTFAELDAAANRLSRLLRAAGQNVDRFNMNDQMAKKFDVDAGPLKEVLA